MENVEVADESDEGPQISETEADSAPSARSLSEVTSSYNDPPKTLVIYSGPTSLDRLQDKNGMYIDNMNYFLEHGISCYDDAPEKSKGEDDETETVTVNYVFVLTKEVADYYTAPNGLITKKIQECKGVEKQVDEKNGKNSPFISVITRQDRCYDMESIRTVFKKMNVQALYTYDNLLFINCGLVGPKLGPGTPKLIPSNKPNARESMVPYSHWSQLYTSRLTDSVRMVGHSINTHFHTFFPHVQSFLYAIRTETVPILLSSGAIYDCGLTQEELGSNAEKRFELINRYEVGMSTQLLKRGYKIATAFVNRYGFGKSLVYDKDSTWGTEIDDTISDIWYEDGIRNLTSTISKPTKWWKNEGKWGLRNPDEDTFDYHKWDILPWDHFVFFKVSRLVPQDVQDEMNYNPQELEKSNVLVVSNDPRKSPNEYWVRKSGGEAFVEPMDDFPETVLKIQMGVACLVLFAVLVKTRMLFLAQNCRLGHLVVKRKIFHSHKM